MKSLNFHPIIHPLGSWILKIPYLVDAYVIREILVRSYKFLALYVNQSLLSYRHIGSLRAMEDRPSPDQMRHIFDKILYINKHVFDSVPIEKCFVCSANPLWIDMWMTKSRIKGDIFTCSFNMKKSNDMSLSSSSVIHQPALLIHIVFIRLKQ